MKGEVKVVRADRVEAVQSSPGCYRRGIFEKDTDSSLLVEIIFEAGKRCGMHKHGAEECFFVLRGHGKAIIDGNEYELEPDMCLYCPAGTPHAIINTRDCESLVMLATFSKHKDEFETTELQAEALMAVAGLGLPSSEATSLDSECVGFRACNPSDYTNWLDIYYGAAFSCHPPHPNSMVLLGQFDGFIPEILGSNRKSL